MAHITKSKRSRLQFSNEIIEALAAEELDTKRIALNQKALQLCYDLLPDHMKRIARLRFREDSQLKDIAKKVGRPLGSVSATLHRIRINLMECVHRKMPLVEAENSVLSYLSRKKIIFFGKKKRFCAKCSYKSLSHECKRSFFERSRITHCACPRWPS